ncbi:MAG: FAS1-like dehydratase domain-containing protein [Dehalococcoidia bacterium]
MPDTETAFQITDEMRAQIGIDSEPWTYEVTTTSVRMYARGIGSEDPIHYDADFAKQQGFRGIVAPLGYIGTPVYLPGSNDPTFGFPRRAGGPRLDIPFKGLLDGGTETEYFDYVCAGDVLEETSHLADLKLREGARPMLFITNESVYKDKATGKVVAKQRLTSIHM